MIKFLSAKLTMFSGFIAGLYLFSTGVEAAVSPNMYELMGAGVKITYSTTGFSGIAQLNYQDPSRNLQFSGEQIRVTPTEIGQMVTVTLEQIPDLKTVTYSLLIPDINLARDVAVFKTTGITTTHLTSIGGPALIEGPVQTYRTQTLRGRASNVNFIQPALSGVLGEVTFSPTCPGP